MTKTLRIKKRFNNANRRLTTEEFKELESLCVADGYIRDPIVVTQSDIIVDGRNRYKIATKHGLKFLTVEKTFADDDEAERWIWRTQLGRRNLSPHDHKYFLGKLYNGTKNQSRGRPKELVEIQPISAGSTAKSLAKREGVSEDTVKRSGKYATAFDKLPPSIRKQIEADPKCATEQAVIKMATMNLDYLGGIARDVRVGNVKNFDEVVRPKNKRAAKPRAAKPPKSKAASLGKCPVCGKSKWSDDGSGLACDGCHQPHGEPAGDPSEQRIKDMRSKTIKTVEALQRAFDDLQAMCAGPDYKEAVAGAKRLLAIAKGWKVK